MKKFTMIILAVAMTVIFAVAPVMAEGTNQAVACSLDLSSVLNFSIDEAALNWSFADFDSGWQQSSPQNLTLNMDYGSPNMTSTITTAMTSGGWGPVCDAGGVRILLDQTTDAGFAVGPLPLPRLAEVSEGVQIYSVMAPVDMVGQIIQIEVDADIYKANMLDPYNHKDFVITFRALVE